jgi:hypothetical protein
MIDPASPRSLAAVSLPLPDAPSPSATQHSGPAAGGPAPAGGPDRCAGGGADPVLCDHCGRTSSNGISCIGMCVADSGY